MERGTTRRNRWRRWIIIGGVLVVAFFVLWGVSASAKRSRPPVALPPFAEATPDSSQPRQAYTYFYYWYDLPDGPHNGALTDRPAEPNASYRNADWFKKQFADMTDAGIDVALAVYWGDAEPSSDVGLANMSRAAAAMSAEGGDPPQIAMFLDTGLIGRWPKGQRDFTNPDNQRRFYSLINTFYSILPRDQWAMVSGRPALWMWASWFEISFDQELFDYVSRRFEEDFGVRPYIVAEASWRFATDVGDGGLDPSRPIHLDGFYAWGASLTGFRDIGSSIAAVGPGYDERELDGPGRSGRFADRENGRFYERNFEGALNTGARTIVIETWNEFHEASDIADSDEFGRQYIAITRRYLDRFKAMPGASP